MRSSRDQNRAPTPADHAGMNEEARPRADSNLEVKPALERGQQLIEVGAPRGAVSVLVEHMHPVLVVGDDERIQ